MSISYLDETDPNINKDILFRKEYQLFKNDIMAIKFKSELKENDEKKNIIPKFLVKDNIQQGDYLELHSYQLFIRNYFNPNTRYSRLLMKWETGLGKTVGALSIALNFINYYQKEEESIEGSFGSVYIIGFTQHIFKNELLKYPEFGFISDIELEQLKKLKNYHIKVIHMILKS